ncbi:MAG: hypothetical protein EXR98_04070 [Gemmataceae bacterium]|nr:hypothetical protein [Gemmataceae bacterium]
MDALSALLDTLKKGGQANGHLRGFLHVFVGRKITRTSDKTLVSKGLAWRELAELLKKVRWDPDAVKELGLDPDEMPPRDRERYWYTAILHAKVDGAEAIDAGNKFAKVLHKLGYEVGPAPGA